MALESIEMKTIRISVDEGISHLTFTQAEKANAMTREFWVEFPEALARLKADCSVRALVISGEGKHFSSGMDLSVFSNNESLNANTAHERERLRHLVKDLQEVFSQLENLRFPVIGVVQGACVGGALDLLSACDMRYATRNSFFCIQEINLAMMADLGALQRLSKLIPQGVVRELAFTGERLPAERALNLGLLNGIFETEDEMRESVGKIAKQIAFRSPLAVSASKEALNYARDNSVADSLEQAALLQSSILDAKEIQSAGLAAAKKTNAVFLDLLPPSSL